MTNAEGEKLASLQENYIKSVNNSYFEVTKTDSQLTLLDLPVQKIIGLDNILNAGEKTPGGYYLISADDKAKLNKLVISGEDGSLEISGTVNAENVQGLNTWILEHSSGEDFVPGLSENNLTDERLAKLESAITELYIENVSSDFTVTNKQLSLNNISMSKVVDLDLTLANKVDKTTFVALEATVKENTVNINELQDILTWKPLTEL